MKAAAGRHPERLLWYAAGRLDPHKAADVERHLALCEDCREDLSMLRSMSRSLRVEEIRSHVPGLDRRLRDERVAIVSPSSESRRRASLAPPSWARWTRPAAAAAAAALIVLTLPSRTLVSKTTFLPTRRGPEAARRLVGLGAWDIDVLLPTQAPAARYVVRVRGLDGSDVAVDGTEQAGPEKPVVVHLLGFPVPGHYVLELDTDRGDGVVRYPYEFDVVRWP